MKNSTSTRTIVKALLAGATIGGVAGAVLGILFAPKRGSETRKKLLADGDELKEALKGKFNQLFDKAKKEVGYEADNKRSQVGNEAYGTGLLK